MSGLHRAAARAFLWAGIVGFAVSVQAAVIREIKVESKGIRVPDPEFVLAYTSVRQGDNLDRRKLTRDVKTLMATGRFSFVDTEITRVPDGLILTYWVELKSRLGSPVIVSGAEEYSDRKIRKWLELEVGDPVDDSIMAVHVQKVLEEYHNHYYPNAKATWKIDTNTTNGFAVVYLKVKEGLHASLRNVYFPGSKAIPYKELKEAMKPRLWNIFSFFTKKGVYNTDELDSDRYMLRGLYLDRGYLDAQVGKPEVTLEKKKRLVASFPITEGNPYRLGEISIVGARVFPLSTLQPLVKVKSGDTAAMNAINKIAGELRDYYQSRGYIRTSVKPVLNPHKTETIVDVKFEIAESTLVYVRDVEIRGNVRTKDEVVRRELTVYPGEVFDQVQARRGERILQNLGFFSSVVSYPRETTDSTQDDLVYELEEKKTGQFMVGAGYSSIDQVLGFVELSQGNFDLFGWPYFTGDGQKLKLRTQIGTQREDYEISFVEPWFLDRKLSLGIDLYRHDLQYLSSDFNERRTGGAVTLGKPIPGWFQRANLRYSLEEICIYDVSTNASQIIQSEAGTRMQSSLRLTLIHDTRDNVFIPKQGNRTTVSSHFSGGILGFDTHVYGFEGESTHYWKLWFGHVFSLRGWAETIESYDGDADVHIFDRLFLGGARTLRGFRYRYVSPMDENNQPIGGKSGALATAEYTIPLFSVVRYATFYDVGNVWEDAYQFKLDEYNTDIGVGLRLDIPGFPVRLDYAWPLDLTDNVTRTDARFNFSLGYAF